MLEAERNELLRRVDWRFLLHRRELPRGQLCASGRLAQAARLICDPVDRVTGSADLVVLSRPSPGRLTAARNALGAGGELYCQWEVPRPGVRRTQRLLERAGFTEIALLWPWPPPALGRPQFWLPLDSRAAVEGFASLRPPPASAVKAGARALWPLAARCGLLAPVCVIARRSGPDNAAVDRADELDELLSALAAGTGGRVRAPSWVLLTGGNRTVNKVVGLPFAPGQRSPELVVKFARVPEADEPLRREAHVLRSLAVIGAPASGVPRLLAIGRRAGRVAIAQTAIHGMTLASQLTSHNFPELASRVTRWLVALIGSASPSARNRWEARLITRPLEEFERTFREAAGGAMFECLRTRLRGLGALPLGCEHRDCAPWNIVLCPDGSPAVLDWESAELHGLPALDLVYFLANAAFLLEGALDSGRTRETYARVLDPTSPVGRVAAECVHQYCSQVGLDARDLPALRLLCWIVHARSEYARVEADVAGAPQPHVLRGSMFLGLIDEELQRPV